MPLNGPTAAHFPVGPAELAFRLFAEHFNPFAQAVEADNFTDRSVCDLEIRA